MAAVFAAVYVVLRASPEHPQSFLRLRGLERLVNVT